MALEVDDGESCVRERGMSGHAIALTIRAAMTEARSHFPQLRFHAWRRRFSREPAGDAAHI